MEYRFRISEEERKLLLDTLKRYILNCYLDITIDELRECLKLFIKFITIDRRFRKNFEKRIDQIINELNKYNKKEAEKIMCEIIDEYEEERERIILEYLNPIEVKAYKFILKNRRKVPEIILMNYFFSLCLSEKIPVKHMNKAFSIFLRKMKKLRVYP